MQIMHSPCMFFKRFFCWTSSHKFEEKNAKMNKYLPQNLNKKNWHVNVVFSG